MPVHPLRERLPLLVLAGLAAIVLVAIRVLGAPAGPQDPRGDRVLDDLAARTGLLPVAARFADPPGGALGDAVRARELFLLARRPGQGADLYRVTVRLAPPRRILDLASLHNLTNSPAGDDEGLALAGSFVAVATRALDSVRSVTIFDRRGASTEPAAGWNLVTRLLDRGSRRLETGSLRGLGRVTLGFTRPPATVALAFVGSPGGPKLRLTWSENGVDRSVVVDPASGEGAPTELVATRERRLPKTPILWAVDTVRALPAIGTGPIEWAEGRVFALTDWWHRTRYRLLGDEGAGGGADPDRPDATQTRARLTAIRVEPGAEVQIAGAEVAWPPPRVVSPAFGKPQGDEGEWWPVSEELVPARPGGLPPIVQTSVRADKERPYAKVHLVAMDLRELELGMIGGFEDPRSTTGSAGTGRLPRDPALLERVVAAFNGAFKTEHGSYGMMAERNVLLPPLDDAATVATDDQGRVLTGSWPKGAPIPPWMVSLRQNMDPLVEDGVVNPRRRYLWGFTLGEDLTQMNTVRSGLCQREDGTLIYAWGEELTARTLGAVMNAAGCRYGLHLDMNPFHTAFIHYRFLPPFDDKKPTYKARLAAGGMRYSVDRYIYGAPKDFFYVARRRLAPAGFTFDGLAQPTPATIPAVSRRGGDVPLVALAGLRARALLVPGRMPDGVPRPADAPTHADRQTALVDLVLPPLAANPGALVREAVISRPSDGAATLATRADGSLALGTWPLTGLISDAVTGAWLRHEGRSVELTATRVVAVGLAPGGLVILGAGSPARLAGELAGLAVDEAVAFAAPAEGPALVVRGVTGPLDEHGRPVSALSEEASLLRFQAAPYQAGQSLADRLTAAKGVAP